MNSSEVFERLSRMGAMPSPSRVALEVMKLSCDLSSSLGDIAQVIETDPALSAKLLRYANSAMVSPATPIASIHKATIKLGMKTVVNLALGFSLLSSNRNGNCETFSYETFWSHSLAKAVAARTFAKISGSLDPDELFVSGLLSNMGSLAFASLFPEEYSRLLSTDFSRESLLSYEHEEFGIDSKELGKELFRAWGLPEHFALAISRSNGKNNDHDEANALVSELSDILSLADTIAEICMLAEPLSEKITRGERKALALGIEEAEFPPIFDEITEIWQTWGHTFNIPTTDIPLYKSIKDSEQPSEQQLEEQDAPIKVLLVDDDPMTLLNLKRLLSKHGKIVYTAENGEDALTIAVEKNPHMVITDWRMPKVSGIELCRVLRNTAITEHIYIIMLTGRESDDELIEALDAGADDFIIKPFTPRVLEARMHSGERIIRFQQMIHKDREVIQKYAARLAAANKKLQTMAMTDSLTGLPNRRSAMTRLKEAVAESQRHREPLACIMIDIDHFKKINDRFGHDVGDQMLKNIATIFNATARSYDVVSRIGGEEFLVICARSTLAESKLLAERLRLAIDTLSFTEDNKIVHTTISLGVACWDKTMTSGEDMTKAADLALYQAKQKGRNRVEVIE